MLTPPWNLYQYLLEVNVVLCEHIYVRSRNRTFQSQPNSSNHCYLQQQRCNNLQISMNSIQRDSQRRYSRCSCALILPKRVELFIILPGLECVAPPAHHTGVTIHSQRNSGRRSNRTPSPQQWTFRKGLPLCQSPSSNNTNSQNSSYGIGSALVCKNFSRWNILKHYNKQKQNCQCSNIDQLMQQYEIFKALLYQKTRTMQKQQNQIKNRMHWVFRLHHLKNTLESTCCNQSERLTHY